MKPSTQLHRLATSLSLFVLALGFSVLGFAPLLSRYSKQANTLFSAENVGAFVGSGFSIFVGAAFLSAAIYFTWLLQVRDRSFPSLENNLSE